MEEEIEIPACVIRARESRQMESIELGKNGEEIALAALLLNNQRTSVFTRATYYMKRH